MQARPNILTQCTRPVVRPEARRKCRESRVRQLARPGLPPAGSVPCVRREAQVLIGTTISKQRAYYDKIMINPWLARNRPPGGGMPPPTDQATSAFLFALSSARTVSVNIDSDISNDAVKTGAQRTRLSACRPACRRCPPPHRSAAQLLQARLQGLTVLSLQALGLPQVDLAMGDAAKHILARAVPAACQRHRRSHGWLQEATRRAARGQRQRPHM